MGYTKKDAAADKELRQIEDEMIKDGVFRDKRPLLLRKLQKGIDLLNALRYTRKHSKDNTKRKKAMSETTTKPKTNKSNKGKVSVKTVVASLIAAPFIITGVASLIESNVPYLPYVLGTLIAGLVIYLLLEK